MLARALLSLRAACSSASTLASRSFSDAAAASSLSKAAESQGAKSALFRILGSVQEPLTAAQVWEAAQAEGLKSKRFTKQMLQQLKTDGWVKTQPLAGGKKHRNFGYRLNQQRQQQRQARLEKRGVPAAGAVAAAAGA